MVVFSESGVLGARNPTILTEVRVQIYHNPGLELLGKNTYCITKFRVVNPALEPRYSRYIGLYLHSSVLKHFLLLKR